MMGSMLRFCPTCWVETPPDEFECPRCGFQMSAFDALGYEGKLLLTLKHPIHENRMLAVQLLGELNSRWAASAFATIIDKEEDPYVLAAIVHSLAGIGGGESRAVLGQLRSHPSVIVQNAIEDVDRPVTDLAP